MPRTLAEFICRLNGGLNTANDPSSIDDGELQEAAGMEYRPPRLGLFAVGGRSRADTTSTAIGGTRIHGLVYCSFDRAASATVTASNYLLAFSDSSAFVGEIGQTVDFYSWKRQISLRPFTDSATGFANATHYNNHWFAFNGTGRGIDFHAPNTSPPTDTSGTVGFNGLGMISVTASGTAVASATVGTLAAGTYELWWSENNGGSTDVTDGGTKNSAYVGTVNSVTLTAANLSIAFTKPTTYGTTAHVDNDWSFDSIWMTEAGGKYPYGFKHFQQSTVSAFTITALNTSAPYDVVQPLGGVPVSLWGEPPRPYAMTTFQDSLVAIDAADRQIVRYSAADEPHAWPVVNYVPFETAQQDKLNALNVCNNALLVFGSWYGYRMDDLPRHTDGDDMSAMRGRAKEPFSFGHGCLSPRGSAVFTLFGSGELCLFVCRDGIHITDGFKTDYASNNLDWYNTVDQATLDRTVLHNNPKFHRVEFYYFDKTTPAKAKRLDFYYHPRLIKRPQQEAAAFPQLPILGPTDVPGVSATIGVLNNDWQGWCGMEASAQVWLENTGVVDNALLVDASGTINKSWRTKNWYFAGINGEFEIERVYTHQSETTASGSYTVTGTWRTDDISSAFTATGTVDQSLKGAQPHPSIFGRAEMFNLRGEKADGGAWQELNYLVFVINERQRLTSAKSNV